MFFSYAVVHRMVIDMNNIEIMISKCVGGNLTFFALVFNNIQIVLENISEQIS